MPVETKSNTQVTALIFFRFVAAIIVINFHYAKEIMSLGHFYTAGQQMVTFFFVLSGFVLGYSYSMRPSVEAKKFYLSRLIKIVPLYMFGLALSLLALNVAHKYIDIHALFLNLLFLQTLVPSYALTFNYPAWFIATQMFMYLLFIPLFSQMKRYSCARLFLVALLLWTLSQIILILLHNSPMSKTDPILIRDIVHYHPLAHLSSFVLGIAGGMWFMLHKEKYQKKSLALFVVTCIICCIGLEYYDNLRGFFPFDIPFGASFFAPVMLLFILALALFANFEFFAKPIPTLLGNASFAIYILHAPLYMLIVNFLELNTHVMLDYLAYLGAAIIVGVVAYIYIEKKLANFLKW